MNDKISKEVILDHINDVLELLENGVILDYTDKTETLSDEHKVGYNAGVKAIMEITRDFIVDGGMDYESN